MTTADIRNALLTAAGDALGELNRLEVDVARQTVRAELAETDRDRQGEVIAKLQTDNAALAARVAELEALLEPAASAPPVVMGMATEAAKWDERVALTGPVAARRVFQPTWNVPGLIAQIKAVLAAGMVPVASIKPIPTKGAPADWEGMAAGAWDARLAALGQELAKLDAPVYFTIHHEPRGGTVDTPAELVAWADMLAHALPIIRDYAPKVQVGTIDNGHPWGQKWGTLTDAQLAVYYTPDLLAACDFLGADFYDGATNTNPGEPAWIKMQAFTEWADRIGYKGRLGVGEWNFVAAQDCADTWPVLDSGRWAFACLFNSDENNRTDLPTSIGGSWSLKAGTDRLAAFRAILDSAVIPGR